MNVTLPAEVFTEDPRLLKRQKALETITHEDS
jgi:hypothetical protein